MKQGLLFVIALSACSHMPGELPIFPVEELQASLLHHEGRKVRVSGIVHECRSNSCGIDGSDQSSLSIGPSVEFDRAIAQQLGQYVTIEATVNTEWISGKLICLDRVGELRNPVLISHRN